MSAPALMFFLMVISHASMTLTLTKLGQFPTKAACSTAQDAVKKAIEPTAGIEIVCISRQSLGDLEAANR